MGAIRTAYSQLLDLAADVAAYDPRLPPGIRGDYWHAVRAALQGEMSRLYGGCEIIISVPKVAAEVRRARAMRIADAISRGEAPAVVAQREGVSARHARRVRGRFGA